MLSRWGILKQFLSTFGSRVGNSLVVSSQYERNKEKNERNERDQKQWNKKSCEIYLL